MASSIHIATGGAGYFAHNSRESKTTNSIFKDEKNYCSCSKDEAFKIYRSELEKRSEAYTNRTGQKLQKKAITHLSAIVNFEQNHDEKDIQKVCDYLEEKFDTKVIQFSLHRDEGHIDENGTAIKNYHAHIEMMGLDSEGASVRKKLTRKSLSDMQTDVAELLEMERGRNFNKEFKEFKNGERDTMPTKAKRLDTYEYKAHKKDEAKQVLAKNKDLKEEIAKLRAEAKTRPEHAKLEQLNRELKAQIKSKDLTIEQLQAKVEEYRDAKATQKVDIDFLKDDIKKLETKVTELEQDKNSDKKLINDLETKNKSLNEELVKKEPKSDLNANMSEFDENEAIEKTKELVNKHISNQTVYKKEIKKEIEKGFLKDKEIEKEVYTPIKKTVIAEPNTFLNKVKEMATISKSYLRDKYEILKTEVKDLKEKVKELTHKNSTYEDVIELNRREFKEYKELLKQGGSEVERIKLAKRLERPLSEKMKEIEEHKNKSIFSKVWETIDQDRELERPSEVMEKQKQSLERLQEKLFSKDNIKSSMSNKEVIEKLKRDKAELEQAKTQSKSKGRQRY